jgi:tetratricopeptide (TPR) repeat protein
LERFRKLFVETQNCHIGSFAFLTGLEMTDKKANPGVIRARTANSQWTECTILAIVCTLVIAIFVWSAEPGFLELSSPRAEDAYYNLLVQGFRAGQLNVKRDPPPGLSALANPYDPNLNNAYAWDRSHLCYEMSYYKGKLYLYFGATPAVVLFWPYAALTGGYLSHADAVVIFFSGGFLVLAGLLYMVWRRYFPGTSVWVVASGLLALGFATGILEILSSCDVYEVAKSSGFLFSMLALAGIWLALQARGKPARWLLLASLAYGLAIGSRPSLIFGAVILLIPAARAWFAPVEPGSRRQAIGLLVAAGGPITLIGLGLMLYNARRFGNPLEFGWHYQLTSFQNVDARQFSLNYLWFNFRFYFLEPMRWGGHFPYLESRIPEPSMKGFFGLASPFAGILSNYPVTWLALAAPLAWKGRWREESSGLRWFVAAVFLLFATCALTMCLFFAAGSAYELDFLPALMLLAVIGIFGLERALTNSPGRRWIARAIWGLLLTYSVVFNALASAESHGAANFFAANFYLNQMRADEAIAHYQTALACEPNSASYHTGLGVAYSILGWKEEAVKELQKAVELNPKYAEAEYDLGVGLLELGRVNEAFAHFERALEIDPHFAETHFADKSKDLAWSLATDPDPSRRNGPLAVKLAEGACRMTHYQTSIMVGTLAATYAEAGRFDDAIATAQKACALASKAGDQELLKKEQELLALYRNHQPYRESPEGGQK